MAKEVQENKRFKITDRKVATKNLFQSKSLDPTVGAGGQFTVALAKPDRSAFSRLAEGLSSMNSALGDVAESEVAATGLAIKKASEMTLDEVKAQQAEFQEIEQSMVKSNGFIDRLTRKGDASVIENPMTFPRAQSATGTRIGKEVYQARVEQAMASAKLAYKRDASKPYSIPAIQKKISDEVSAEFNMSEGFSMQRGFDKVAAPYNAKQLAREFNEQDRIAEAWATVGGAEKSKEALVILGDSTSSPQAIKDAFDDLAMNTANLGRQSIMKMLDMAGADLARDNPQALQLALNRSDESDVMIGGFPLNSPAYTEVINKWEDMVIREQNKMERETDKAISENNDRIKDTGITILSRGDEQTPASMGLDIEGLDSQAPIPREELYEAFKKDEITKAWASGNGAKTEAMLFSLDTTAEARDERDRSRISRDGATAASNGRNLSTGGVSFQTEKAMFLSKHGSQRSLSFEAAEIDRSIKADLTAIQSDMKQGKYPDGAEVIKGEGGVPIPFSELDSDTKDLIAKKATDEIYKKGVSSIIDISKRERDKEDAEELKKSKDIPIDKKDSNYKESLKTFKIDDKTKGRLNIPEFADHNAAKAKSNVSEYLNYIMFNMSKDERVNIIRLGEESERGSFKRNLAKYNRGGIKEGTFIATTQYSSEEVRNMKSIAEFYDTLTPLTIDEVSEITSTGYIPSRRGTLDPDSIGERWFEYNTEEEKNQIIEKIRKFDRTFTGERLEANRKKRIKTTE